MANNLPNRLPMIRPYRKSDLPSIVDIYAASKMDELKHEPRTFEFLPLLQDKVRAEKLFESKIYVFEEETVVGYCAFFGDEIRALFVEPGRRGQGIGKQMLEFLLSCITGKPYLFVAKSNLPAKRLYQHYGFRVVDEFETHYNNVAVLANKMAKVGEPSA